jgi:hypothetical protein
VQIDSELELGGWGVLRADKEVLDALVRQRVRYTDRIKDVAKVTCCRALPANRHSLKIWRLCAYMRWLAAACGFTWGAIEGLT